MEVEEEKLKKLKLEITTQVIPDNMEIAQNQKILGKMLYILGTQLSRILEELA
jgi:hypothetical protein